MTVASLVMLIELVHNVIISSDVVFFKKAIPDHRKIVSTMFITLYPFALFYL